MKDMSRRKLVRPYLFLLPTLLILIVYSYLPVFYGIFLSFQDMNPGTGEMKFAGLKNYSRILQDAALGERIKNTLVYVVGATAVVVVFGLIVASILNSKIRGTSFYLTILFIPWVLSDVVVGNTWTWLFNPDVGVLKYLFEPLGIDPSILLNNPKYAMFGVIIVTLWKMLAYNTILLLAGMQNLSKDYIEAAQLDGCTGMQLKRYIVLPILTPTIITVILLSIINCISQTGMILVLTNGGPLTSTQTLAVLLYKEAFVNFNFSSATAMSMVLAVINIAIVLVYLRLTRKTTVDQ